MPSCIHTANFVFICPSPNLRLSRLHSSIALNLQMLGMDGFEIARMIRERLVIQHLLMILITTIK
ncbi:MAG: hypothetical protein AB1589_14835 [Cyanobacteriota bacterium]